MSLDTTVSSYAGLAFPKGRWAAFAGVAGDLPRCVDEGAKVTFGYTRAPC